jgi:DNA segregation ATPase FtsK/SpoIIIE, S-DNA-T family
MSDQPRRDAEPAIPRARRGDEDTYDTHFEIALDDEPDTRAPVYVDVVSRDDNRRLIIPAEWHGKDNIKATVKRKAAVTGHRAAYHGVRFLPLYLPLGLFWAAIGVFRLLGRQIRWWWVVEQHQLRQEAASRNQPEVWDKLHREAKATRLYRGLVLAGEAVALIITLVTLSVFVGGWAIALVTALSVPILAHFGRPTTKPIITPAVVAPRFRVINSDVVLRAYYAAGLGHSDKKDQQITFGSRMTEDAKHTGSQVKVILPFNGKTMEDVLKAKGAIAAGLDVSENQVFLSRDRKTNRAHDLFIAHEDPLAKPAGHTDLLNGKIRSVWKPMRLGFDERDSLVTLLLVWNSILIGAQPRKGKTFTARLVALYCALDPWVKLIVVDGKKSSDWNKFPLVAHRFIVGTHPNPRDSDPINHLLATLNEVLAHIDRVNDVLASLPPDLCPEGVLTEELTQNPRFPDLRFWVLVMEEFQVYFETEDQDINKEIAAKLSRIQATGPSAGVIVISSSQKPSGVGAGDVGRLFNRYRDNHQVRFALKCGNRDVSIAVLGGDSYQEGYDASTLPVGLEYRGVGYLYGASDATPTVRTLLADHVDAEKILVAARTHRERLGTLSGEAAGEDIAREVRDVLADVLNVFYAGKATISWPALAARLAETYPEAYADINAKAISSMVRKFGVPNKSVKDPEHFESGVGQGCDKAAIQAAINRREIESR